MSRVAGRLWTYDVQNAWTDLYRSGVVGFIFYIVSTTRIDIAWYEVSCKKVFPIGGNINRFGRRSVHNAKIY